MDLHLLIGKKAIWPALALCLTNFSIPVHSLFGLLYT